MLEASMIFAAGVWAGTINVIVGSGTLVTFPTLLLFGYPPLVANVSNNLGMVAGGVSGIYGYRRELQEHKVILKRLSPMSIAGALIGALLLLVLPANSFKSVVPILIALGIAMVVVGPALQRRTARRDVALGRDTRVETVAARATLITGIFVLGAYGGYFGAGQGILLIGLMGMLLSEGIQELTAIKILLATLANAVAAITFVVVARDLIDWHVVAFISSGAFLGGHLGARIGRRLPPVLLRALIVIIGILAIAKIVLFD